jgi:signal transduction histidine kinase
MLRRISQKLSNPAHLLGLVLALALAVLGLTIAQGCAHLQRVVRRQMENRDGEILYAVAMAQQFGNKSANLVQRLQDPVEQLALTLQISQLEDGVLGVRLFDAHGHFITAFPPNVTAATLSPGTFSELKELRPVSRYNEAGRLADLFLMNPAASAADTNSLPLLEANIPIHAQGETQLLASAQLLLDAHDLARQAARFERHLRLQALGIFLLGGGLLTVALLWASRRLRKASQLIQERTSSLLRANHELTLAAKTSALGAMTAHLIHGLSNPLANLQEFVASHAGGDDPKGDWREALGETRQMQQLVHEVVRVLGEEDKDEAYEITLAELAGVLHDKIQPTARALGVHCDVSLSAEGQIHNHPANLILLILENVIRNALQVTPRGKTVRVSIAATGSGAVCAVADEGPGFPEHFLRSPFMPCRSTKGGAGLGLAISKQLASHLDAQLELQQTGPSGSIIVLALPHKVFAGSHETAAVAT